MYAVRRWVVRHARAFEALYDAFEPWLVRLHPLWNSIGYQRAEKPVAAVERLVKGLLFDCRMCGQCALGSTGMSCPMNCPKRVRNGPCGGVRADGGCEVEPSMACVWLDAWQGSRQMRKGDSIATVSFPVDHSLQGTSSWLRVVRRKAEQRQTAQAEV